MRVTLTLKTGRNALEETETRISNPNMLMMIASIHSYVTSLSNTIRKRMENIPYSDTLLLALLVATIPARIKETQWEHIQSRHFSDPVFDSDAIASVVRRYECVCDGRRVLKKAGVVLYNDRARQVELI